MRGKLRRTNFCGFEIFANFASFPMIFKHYKPPIFNIKRDSFYEEAQMDPYRTLPRYSYVCRRSGVLPASLTTTTTISMKKPIFLFPDFLRVISYIVYIEIFICMKANLSVQISCGFTRRTYCAGARQISKIAPGN